jgi:hypothetical protein
MILIVSQENFFSFKKCLVGVVDGKHCQILCQPESGSDFFLISTSFFSMFLMVVSDAQ